MIQCVICEDWYHGRHLKVDKLPKDENYAEMLCYLCREKHQSILAPYQGVSVTTLLDESLANTSSVSVSDNLDESLPNASTSSASVNESKKCKIADFDKEKADKTATTLFMPQNWRSDLCKCDGCVKLFAEHNVSFLLDEEDTVHHYESQAKNEGIVFRFLKGIYLRAELFKTILNHRHSIRERNGGSFSYGSSEASRGH